MSDLRTTTPPPTQEIRTIGAVLYFVVTLLGLLPQIILAAVFVRNWNSFKHMTFYVIATQMLVCDVGCLLLQLYVAAPMTYLGENYLGTNVFYLGSMVMETVCYTGMLSFTFMMALNRLLVFICPILNKFLFSTTSINGYITVLVTWVYVITMITIANMASCPKNFSYAGFYFYMRCYAWSEPIGVVVKEYMRYMSYVLPCTMFVMYLIVFVYLRSNGSQKDSTKEREKKKRRKQEMNFLIMSFIICFILEVQTLAFSVRSQIMASDYWSYYLNIIQNIISILNNSATPFVYFVFNKEIRNSAISLFRGNTKENQKLFTPTRITVTG